MTAMRFHCILQIFISIMLSSCSGVSKTSEPTEASWKEELSAKMPLLGHRNWIVVTDMAYPLQISPGIITIYAPQPFSEVVGFVAGHIKKSDHLSSTVYQDSELLSLTNEILPGVMDYRDSLSHELSDDHVVYMPHEQLIHKLDSAARLYQVVIIKTDLTVPYSSVFFELGCGYWDDVKESALRESVKSQSVN